jgi:anhydro-N-acetylmuramic acid kinase
MQWSLGLMSGTSMDGVDAALLETDGERIGRFGPAMTVAYPPALRASLRGVLGGVGDVGATERAVTLFHADVVETLLAGADLARADVSVVGFHGHTILHAPTAGRTWQIGDGPLLRERLGLPVINDFRSADVAAGGEGAPLVPAYHAALSDALPRPLALLNIGGVANVTWIGRAIGPGIVTDDALLAFDTGPGNALLDDWTLRHTGRPMDEDGALAATGTVDRAAVAAFVAHPYFARLPPKSLDRDDFARHAATLVDGLSPADGAATLLACTIAGVRAAQAHFPAAPRQWLVCGGGRHNRLLMDRLQDSLAAPVAPVESVGWDGDALEAQAFAFLAVRSLRGLPLSWPSTTGVAKPQTGGRLYG